ncbi:MAG: antiviral RADAR system adenosine deaminase RdrB [Plesiomonas shigelloides]
MLQRSLTEHAAECFYGDERLADWLWQKLQPTSVDFAADFWDKLQGQVYHLLVEGMEARYPREHRLTDVRQLMGQMCDGDLLVTPELPWLDELQQRLLQRNGDLLCYRERECQAYVRLAAGLDPTLLVGWHLAQWLEDIPQPGAHDIERVVSAQTAFFAPPGNPSLHFAEGHVHFWGVTADSSILDDYLLAGRELTQNKTTSHWQQEQQDKLQPLLQRARQLLILLLEPDMASPSAKAPPTQTEQSQSKKWQSWQKNMKRLSMPMDEHIALPDWELLINIQAAANVGSVDWLLGEFANTMLRGHANRWLWLYLYLCRRYQATDTHPLQRAAILCFWQTVNLLRRNLIMDGQGLTRFAEHYFGATLGRGKKSPHDNFRRLWTASGDVTEIKSGPNAFSAEFTRPFAKAMAKNVGLQLPKPPYIFGEHEIYPDAKTQAYLENLERWQFCGHFSRSKLHKQSQRPKSDSKDLWKEAEKLMRNLQSDAGWASPEFLGGKLNQNFHFQPARWFRGLDVAGDENALKIEWFAPVLRWLRGGFKSSPSDGRASTGFHLSIHAGEDYAHPASGLRHIDETVRFCEMREGDRLGHVLALGIEPKQWCKRQGEMIMPLDEHLDNLVWLWHYATILSGHLPLAQQVQPLLERRIARFWHESDWWKIPNLVDSNRLSANSTNVDNPQLRHATANDLYQAWLLRRNCHYRWQELLGGVRYDAKDVLALPDHQQLGEKNNLAAQLYLARHQWLQTSKKEQLVIVRIGSESNAQANIGKKRKDNLHEDVETPAELDFMHALQDWLLSEYDLLGLIIEANPTSNVYIARLKSHAEHPIFRWSPPDEAVLEKGAAANLYGLRRGPVRVLVNTDDPGIMPTTLRTEFLLLREAAIELNVGRTVAERWLEMLRQYGIEQFNRNHLPVFELV